MHYHVLYDIAKGLHEAHLDMNRGLQLLPGRVGQAMGVSYSVLMTFTESGEIDHIYIPGEKEESPANDPQKWMQLYSRGLIGYVYHSERSIAIRNIESDPRWTITDDLNFLPETGSAVGIPLRYNDVVTGVMVFVHPKIDYFGDDALEFLHEVADLTSKAFTSIYRTQQQEKAVQDTRYYAIFEHTHVPVVLTDSSGVIIDANIKACEFLGFRRVVLRGIPLQDVNIISFDDIKDIDHEEEKHITTNTYDIDGNSIPTLIRARWIELDGNRYIEWILQDMSVQMELEQLRRDLTAMVYHDLRGPMGSIHMAIIKLAELLQGHDNPAVLKILQLGLRSTQQVSRLVEALLDIQRLESGSTILNKQPAEVHVFLTDAFQLVMPIADHAGISIDLDIAKLPEILIDTDMITRVVINLMENAVKYTPSGSRITLRSELVNNKIQITVSDTGPGIPGHMLDSIFNKFSRVKYQDAPKGVGLGLAFCRLAVEAHGGKIRVESDGETGSDFIFTLPLDDMPDTAPLSDTVPDEEDDAERGYATTA